MTHPVSMTEDQTSATRPSTSLLNPALQSKTISVIKTVPEINNPELFLCSLLSVKGEKMPSSFSFLPHTCPDEILESFGHNINTLDLLAIMAALKLWGMLLRGTCFILECDNESSAGF